MKKILILCIFCLGCSLAFAKEPINYIYGKVIKVSDGDTITILPKEKKQIRIRLYGIDAPEKKQAFGEKSRQYLASLIAGKDVKVNVYDIDRYGRNVAIIINEDKNINKEMVAAGYAWVYLQYNKLPDLPEWLKLQEAAQKERLGLWRDKNPIPPHEFRKLRRAKKI